jgi:hypothetical protein
MSAVRQPRAKRFNYRKLPVSVQWGLPFGVAMIAIVALVVWVVHEGKYVSSEATVNSPAALAAQQQEADAVMSQVQAPHSARLKPGTRPADGLMAAITTWLAGQIKINQVNGPLMGGSCSTTTGSTSARVAMYCKPVAANVYYDFYGVVIPATGRITFCEQATPPVNGMPDIPFSASCVATPTT